MAESKEFNLDALQALQKLTLGTNHVERWQGTPQLLPYNVSTHAYNCAMLYMQLCFICRKQVSIRLLSALLCHDNMESLTGDLLAPAKDLVPASWDLIEEQVQEKWAKENKVVLNQEYEYSDMVSEYAVISQNLKAGDAIDTKKYIDSLGLNYDDIKNKIRQWIITAKNNQMIIIYYDDFFTCHFDQLHSNFIVSSDMLKSVLQIV